MKQLDLSRLVDIGVGETIAVMANRPKTIRGVATATTAVWALVEALEGETPEQMLYDVIEPGRFAVEVHHDKNVAVWFEKITPETPHAVSVVWPAHVTKIVGNPETSFTKVGHRPAVNPEMAALLRQMKLMNGEIQRLSARPAPVQKAEPAPAPVPNAEPAPAPAPGAAE